MDEYDEPLTLELHDERELAVLMTALGTGATLLLQNGMVSGAAATGNLQNRLATEHTQEAVNALEEMGIEAGIPNHGSLSVSAAMAKLREKDEVDPDSIEDGTL